MTLYIAHPSEVSDTTGGPYKKEGVYSKISTKAQLHRIFLHSCHLRHRTLEAGFFFTLSEK